MGASPCLEELGRITSGLHLDGVVWDHHAQGSAIDDQRDLDHIRDQLALQVRFLGKRPQIPQGNLRRQVAQT